MTKKEYCGRCNLLEKKVRQLRQDVMKETFTAEEREILRTALDWYIDDRMECSKVERLEGIEDYNKAAADEATKLLEKI